jgi:hypothetical protein
MAMDLKILYWENGATVERFVSMGDTTKMDDDVQIPKNNVIFMIFSTKVQGQDTRLYEKYGFDNYQVSLNELINIASMYAFDDSDGGWFRIATPTANDGYQKAVTHPILYPYGKANEISWMFTGIQLTQAEWDSTEQTRNDLR